MTYKLVLRLLITAVAILVLVAAGTSFGAVAGTYELPDSLFVSNTVVEIIEHDGGIWMATSRGVNFSLDGGDTWLLYTDENGLNSDDISAMFSRNGRIWLAGAYTDDASGGTVTFSDTIMYSDDSPPLSNPEYIWSTVDVSPLEDVFGAAKTVFDIGGGSAEGDEWMFFTAFAGGFIGSRDGGESWRRLHPSRSDSVAFWRFYNDPNNTQDLALRLRFFSTGVDTMHGDSMFVYAGTAGGVLQYIFAPRANKPNSREVTDIVVCENCDTSDTLRVFLAGENGVTRASAYGQPFRSIGVDAGLPGPYISTLFEFDGRLWAGTREASDGNSTGLAISDDGGLSFSTADVAGFNSSYTGANRQISDMAEIGGRLYVSAEEAGLLVSADTGATWQQIMVDTSDISPANRRNVTWGLDALGDTLRVGTDSGLVTLYMDPAGTIDSTRFDVFFEVQFVSGARVLDVFTQVFEDSLGTFDSLAVWTINRPLTESGAPCVFRGSLFPDYPLPGDTTFQWNPAYQQNVNTNDMAFNGDTAFVVGDAGIRFTYTGINPGEGSGTLLEVRDTTSADRFANERITAMHIFGDTVFIGSDSGFAIHHNAVSDTRFKIFRINLDTLSADIVINYTSTTTLGGIAGDFIPAMGIQPVDTAEFPYVWLSCRPAIGGTRGISLGRYTEFDTTGRKALSWETILADQFAWNFAYNGDTAFVAADSAGLLMYNIETPGVWDTIPLIDVDSQLLVDPGVPIYGVEVVDSSLWVGTDKATVRVRLDSLVSDRDFFYVDSLTAPEEVYAFPVPYRVSTEGGVDFHFELQEPTSVTLEIYDAAMNLVYRLMDERQLDAGVYHGRNTGIPTWNGRNGRGDEVAVGVYYFKVELGTGDVRWGKVAVIP